MHIGNCGDQQVMNTACQHTVADTVFAGNGTQTVGVAHTNENCLAADGKTGAAFEDTIIIYVTDAEETTPEETTPEETTPEETTPEETTPEETTPEETTPEETTAEETTAEETTASNAENSNEGEVDPEN